MKIFVLPFSFVFGFLVAIAVSILFLKIAFRFFSSIKNINWNTVRPSVLGTFLLSPASVLAGFILFSVFIGDSSLINLNIKVFQPQLFLTTTALGLLLQILFGKRLSISWEDSNSNDRIEWLTIENLLFGRLHKVNMKDIVSFEKHSSFLSPRNRMVRFILVDGTAIDSGFGEEILPKLKAYEQE